MDEDLTSAEDAFATGVGTMDPRADREGLVERPRLLEALSSAPDVPIVSVVAPAGFGKSTLLSQWAQSDGRGFAWLTMSDRDDDPLVLAERIADALATVGADVEAVRSELEEPHPNVDGGVIPCLMRAVREAPREFVLVLDDLHKVTSDKSTEVVSAIVDSMAPGSSIAIGSRGDPRLRIGRLRANRLLLEVGANDLAMTRAEGRRLFEGCGLHIDRSGIARLIDHTEGWPAALYLAALELGASDDVDAAIDQFAGASRPVAEYLRDEFLSRLNENDVAFLTGTSILDPLSGPICDHLLGRSDSGEVLQRLSRANLLIAPLGGVDYEYRYHSLLREMLLAELHRTNPTRETELQQRASAFYKEKGDLERAIPHAIATANPDVAGPLIWAVAPDLAGRGRMETLRRWLDRIGDEAISTSPPLCLAKGTMFLARGDGAEVEHWTSTAQGGLDRLDPQDQERIGLGIEVLRLSGAVRVGAAAMAQRAELCFRALPDDNPWRSLCCFVEGAGLHLIGDPSAAKPRLEEGARRGAAQAPHVQTLCYSQLALIALDEEDPEAAHLLTTHAIAILEKGGLSDYPTSALVYAVSALVLAKRGREGDATVDLRRAGRLLATLGEISPWFEIETRIVLARTRLLLDDVAEARQQLAQCGRRMRHVPDGAVLSEWIDAGWQRADASRADARWPLTPAELRLLHFLPTHLSFREVAEELIVSQNTVKTQAQAIYGKLGVSSRAEAVTCARAAGLLDHP